jgi:hypothetical protein
MFKHPLQIKQEDLEVLLDKPLTIHLGSIDKNEVTEILIGTIVQYRLAANSPYLPINFKFETKNGEIRSINLFELKKIELIE